MRSFCGAGPLRSPTAVHEVSEAQDTPSISLFELPVAGVAWMAQVFPLRPERYLRHQVLLCR